MKFFTLLFSYLLISSRVLVAQTSVWQDNYDEATISSAYLVGDDGGAKTYTLTQADGLLKIDYNRSATSSKWTQFGLTLTGVSLLSDSKITLEIKSDKAFQIALKPVSGSVSDWITKDIPGNSTFATYTFTLQAVKYMDLTNIYFYFDGGSSTAKTATVYFDNLDVTTTVKPLVIPKNIIDKADLFYNSITEGSAEGEYASGTKDIVISAINYAKARNTAGAKDLNELNLLIKNLNDTLMLADTRINLASQPLIDSLATKQTVYLYNNLKKIMGNKFLFGMHDANAYGINENKTNWNDDGSGERSDVKTVCGSHPAIFSMDFANVIEGNNPDNVRHLMLKADSMGALITMVWHQDNLNGGDSWKTTNVVSSMLIGGVNHAKYINKLNKLADFAKSMRNNKGESVPLIFRPYHEQSGSWFWWGKGNCTTQDYNLLWQQTVHYLRDSVNVHNLIYVFSPDGQQYNTKAQYLDIYPGDTYVDVFGLDFYFGAGDQSEVKKFSDRVSWISEYAVAKDKVAAVAESGDRYLWEAGGAPDAIAIPNWYTRCFMGGIKNATTNKIAYAATWRNGSTTHHFAPYPGHKAVPDFQNFFDDTTTLFLNDIKNFYSSPNGENLLKPMSGCRISEFSINNTKAVIDIWKPTLSNFTINISLPDTLDLNNLIPVFKSSAGATVKVNNQIQQSGVDSHNFNTRIIYTVIAENNVDSAVYEVVIDLKNSVLKTANNELKIFPNPVSEKLTISSIERITSIQIFNIYGQLMYANNYNGTNAVISMKGYKSGNYMLNIISANGQRNSELIVKN